MARVDRKTGIYRDQEILSDDRRREHQLRVVRELVDVAYDKSSEFRARLDSAGMKPNGIDSLEAFANIPVLRKKELLGLQTTGERLGGMVTTGLGKLRRIYQSPGPIYDPEGRDRDYWGWAEAFYAAGFREADLVQMTFSYHMTPAGLMLEEPLMELGCAVFPAGPGNTEAQIEVMTTLPVAGFVGMASFLGIIGDKAEAAGKDLKKDFGLEVAFVAAERLPEALRRGLEKRFSMIVRQGYGTADVGCIAYECQELGGMHLTSRGLVEICDPETHKPLSAGETGEVIFTPFNDVYPLIRLATGDLSYLVEGECGCGRTSSKLGGIVGRVDDTAKVKGQFIYPSQAAAVMTGFPQVTNWQIRVDNPGGRDNLLLVLEADGPLDEAAFVKAFQQRMKLRPQLEIVRPGDRLEEGAVRLVDARTFD